MNVSDLESILTFHPTESFTMKLLEFLSLGEVLP